MLINDPMTAEIANCICLANYTITVPWECGKHCLSQSAMPCCRTANERAAQLNRLMD